MSKLSKAERHAIRRWVRLQSSISGFAVLMMPKWQRPIAMAEVRKRMFCSINEDRWDLKMGLGWLINQPLYR